MDDLPTACWPDACRAGNVYATFSRPLPYRVSSAVLKRTTQSPMLLPDIFYAQVWRRTTKSMGRLRAGLWLQLPVVTSTCCFATPPSPQDLMNGLERWVCTKNPVREGDYSGKARAQRQSHSLGIRSLVPVARKIATPGDFVSCNGWPCVLLCPCTPFALHSALLLRLPDRWTLLLVSSAQSTVSSLHMLGGQSLDSPRVNNPAVSLNLVWLCVCVCKCLETYNNYIIIFILGMRIWLCYDIHNIY